MGLWGGCQPALLIRQSMRPNLLAVKSINLLDVVDLGHVGAHEQRLSPGPLRFTSASKALPSASLREQNTTFDPPSSTNTFTQPAPMPLLPPVTIGDLVLVSHRS